LFDISSGNLLETVDAHEDSIWSIALSPDKVCMFTMSGKESKTRLKANL